MTPGKRFIAGAVCPECGELDKIYVEREGEDLVRRCSRCDFSERRPSDGGTADKEGWQPVKFKDP